MGERLEIGLTWPYVIYPRKKTEGNTDVFLWKYIYMP
jgi:hypothetical protein